MDVERSYQHLPVHTQEEEETPVQKLSYNRQSYQERPHIPNLDITKTAVKDMVNGHLNKRNYEKEQSFAEQKRFDYIKIDENRPPEQDRPKM